ncbi:MAG: hypothetical protein OXU20_14905, partial [Myxococcales bacterium]|nr:hypothetical protein [Myxococcales bacterium]
PPPSDPLAAPEACCVAHSDPGCEARDVAECVCDFDPYCCEVAWDGICVVQLERRGCGTCGGVRDEPPEPPPPGSPAAPSWCSARREPGSGEASIDACVCTHDPYCCEIAWDAECVSGIREHECAPCPDR